MLLALFTTLHDIYQRVTEGRSPRWPALRKKFLQWQPECQACGNKNLKLLNVHHIKSFLYYPELEEEWSNLITLCEKGPAGLNCHLVVGHTGNWKQWNPDVREDARYVRNLLSRGLSLRLSQEENLLRS